MTDSDSRLDELNRRELMTLAAGGVVALSGCSGSGGGGTATENPTPTEMQGGDGGGTGDGSGDGDGGTPQSGKYKVTDQMLTQHYGGNPSKITFNTWHPSLAFDADNWTAEAYYNMSYGNYNDLNAKGDPKYNEGSADIQLTMRHTYPATNKPWDADHSVGNVTLRKMVTWSGMDDGAKKPTQYTTGAEAVSDDTFRLNLAEGNPEVNLINGINDEATSRRPLKMHRDAMEKAREVTSQQGARDLVKPLLNKKIPFEDAKGKIELGAAKMVDLSPQRIKLEFQPEAGGDYPWGLTYNPDVTQTFKGLNWEAFAEDQVLARMKQGNLWASTRGWDVADSIPDSWKAAVAESLFTGQLVFGRKGIFGENSERSRQLRKALAYWVDHNQVLQFFGKTAREAKKIPASISLGPLCTDFAIEKYISDDLWNSMTHYGGLRAFDKNNQRQAEKAKQAMKAGGFSKKGGKWRHPDTGEPLVINAQQGAPKFGNKPQDYTPWESQFSAFGIESKVITAQNEEEVDAAVQQQSYDLLFTTSSGISMLASLAFKNQHGLGGPDLHPTRGYTDARNGVGKPKVPPVGKPDADPVTMNYDKLVLDTIKLQSDTEKYKQNIAKMGWMYNQWVPNIATFGGTTPRWFNMDFVEWKHGSYESYLDAMPHEGWPTSSNPSLQIKGGFLIAPGSKQ